MIAEFVLYGCRLPTRPIANCLFLYSETNLCAIVFKWKKKSKRGKKKHSQNAFARRFLFHTDKEDLRLSSNQAHSRLVVGFSSQLKSYER